MSITCDKQPTQRYRLVEEFLKALVSASNEVQSNDIVTFALG